jgi:hypothetical protein
MSESQSLALKAVSDAVLAVASKLSVDEVLQRLVDSPGRWWGRATRHWHEFGDSHMILP